MAGPLVQPSTRSVLGVLPKARLLHVARDMDVEVSGSATKDALAESLSRAARFRDVVQQLGRDELRAACRAHGLPDDSRSRPALLARLLEAHGISDTVPPKPLW